MIGSILLCEKCFSTLKVTFKTEKYGKVEVLSLYEYNEYFKTLLFNLKALGDIALGPVFLDRFKYFLKVKYRGYKLLPAPSTIESDTKRGFNHVITLFSILGLPFLNLVSKKESFKQSDLSFHERQKIEDKLMINDGHLLRGKKILIVDDIKTTGATIKAIINLVKDYNPKEVKVLTIAATTS